MKKLILILLLSACASTVKVEPKSIPDCLLGSKQERWESYLVESNKYTTAKVDYFQNCYNSVDDYCINLANYLEQEDLYVEQLEVLYNETCPKSN